jgi:CubicO group peptidase (beta-lactamase class C family)
VSTLDRPTIDPADAGIDPAALESLRERIRTEHAAGRLPAAQLALAVDGRLALVESFGAATDATRFNVFSCTKALIAGVVWQLLAEGRLEERTRAIELIPGFGTRGTTPEWMAEVTLEHLLTHTSGFPTAPLGPPRWSTREGRLEAFAKWRASWEPGTHFQYHPTAAHWVVAEMIEAVEGRDYRTVVRERLLEPLGLTALALGVAPEDGADIAELEIVGSPPSAEELRAVFGSADVDLGEVTTAVLVQFNDPEVRAVGVPGGGAVSSAADLALYYQALLHDPLGLWDPAILADGTGRIRCTLPDPMTGAPANRSLGLVVSGDDDFRKFRGMGPTVSPRAFGHNGAGGQIAWGDPATGVSFVLLTSALDRNVVHEARRIASLAARSGRLVPAAGG